MSLSSSRQHWTCADVLTPFLFLNFVAGVCPDRKLPARVGVGGTAVARTRINDCSAIGRLSGGSATAVHPRECRSRFLSPSEPQAGGLPPMGPEVEWSSRNNLEQPTQTAPRHSFLPHYRTNHSLAACRSLHPPPIFLTHSTILLPHVIALYCCLSSPAPPPTPSLCHSLSTHELTLEPTTGLGFLNDHLPPAACRRFTDYPALCSHWLSRPDWRSTSARPL